MKKCILGFLIGILVAILMAAPPIFNRLDNVQLRGILFVSGDKICGERTWGTNGTADTLVVSGVDTSCAVFLQPKTTQIENLYYDIHSAGDSIFVTSDSAGVADTDEYSYLIVHNAYGASD